MAKKGQETRERVLVAALASFRKKDFGSVTLSQIGKEAGISHATIYEYFDTKEDLFLAACQKAIDEARRHIDARIDPREAAVGRLRAHLRGNLEIPLRYPEYVTPMLCILYFGAFLESFRQLQLAFDRGATQRLELLLIQGGHEGVWKLKQTGTTARQIHDILMGEMIKSYYAPEEPTEEARFKLVWGAVRSILGLA
jgi:AcrR family transcriptional regulator